MRVLFTGTSSFTGLWFIRALAQIGLDVVAVARRPLDSYEGLAAERLRRAGRYARIIDSCAFGSEAFVDLLGQASPFDILCLHGADASDHRSERFDVFRATEGNCRNAGKVFERVVERGCRHVLVTGSLFEADVGQSTQPIGAFSGYGLSKTLSWQILRFEAEQRGLPISRFIVPHPFGAFEKPGLTTSFARAWLAGETPVLHQPHFVRDFAPVDALAEAYARLVETCSKSATPVEFGPSGWVEPTGEFAAKFAAAMRPRFERPCNFEVCARPASTREPSLRHNKDPLWGFAPKWREDHFWDSSAVWYLRDNIEYSA